MILKLLCFVSVCIACLMPYLASRRQVLLAASFDSRIQKTLLWCGFALFQLIAIWGFGQFYSLLVASLIVLALQMCVWVVIVVVSAHLPQRFALVCSIILGVGSIISLAGGVNAQ